MQPDKQVYLFDFDGTLVDSMPTYVSVMLRILDEYSVSYGDDIVRIITPLGYRGTAEYYRTLGVSASVEELMSRMSAYALEAYKTTIPEKEGVGESLRALKARGASLNVLTASPHAALDPCLKRLGLWDLFDNVWSCDDFDTTKADPDIYVRAAQRLGVSVEDVIFLDDNLNAIKTAKRAGMLVFGVYDDSSADCATEMREVSHRYIQCFTELIEEARE